MKKILSALILYTVVSVILLPAFVTMLYGVTPQEKKTEEPLLMEEAPDVPLLPSEGGSKKEEQEEPVALEEYIKGVVGAEMPALFEMEALKAQAVAARTYAVRQIEQSAGELTHIEPKEIGQAYLTKEALQEKWGEHFEEYYKRVCDAVDSTRGQILVFEEEPILAVFHSESAGVTEDSENIWGKALPYLKSVDSSQDENAPGFENTVEISVKEAILSLQKKFPDLKLTQADFLSQMQIAERTEAGYVKTVQVGNKMLTGRDVREALGLRSSNFTVRQEGDTLFFTTKGYGHGAGMSQYGANFMAKDGKSYEEILKHYYQGVELKTMTEAIEK